MNTLSIKNIQYPQTFVTVFLALALLLLTFKLGAGNDTQKTIYEPSKTHLHGICGAIVGLKYRQQRYACPEEIFNKLEGIGFFFNKTAPETNDIIQESAKLTNVNWQQTFTGGETGAGYVDYSYLAFLLFGLRIESLLYLYFFLFFVSVVIFWLAFRRDPLGPFILLTFLLAHYSVVKAAASVGYNLGNVVNYRFLPVLGVLPAIHICLLSLLGRRLSGYTFIGAVFQSIIIAFVLWVRGGAIWMVVLVVFLAVLKFFCGLFKFKTGLENGRRRIWAVIPGKIIQLRLWPIALFLSTFLFLVIGKPFILGDKYNQNSSTGYHIVWHNVYIGLALHPDIREKFSSVHADENFDVNKYYDLVVTPAEGRTDSVYKAVARKWVSRHPEISKKFLVWRKKYDFKEKDTYGYDAAFKWLKDNNLSEYYFFNFNSEDGVDYYSAFPSWFKNRKQSNVKREFRFRSDLKWPVYDKILAKVTKEAVLRSPGEVVQALFIIKPILFLSNYLNYFGLLSNLPSLFLVILIVVHICLLLDKQWQNKESGLLLFLGMVFIFSLIPPILIYPAAYIIADSALIFTLCLLVIFFTLINTCITKFVKVLRKISFFKKGYEGA